MPPSAPDLPAALDGFSELVTAPAGVRTAESAPAPPYVACPDLRGTPERDARLLQRVLFVQDFLSLLARQIEAAEHNLPRMLEEIARLPNGYETAAAHGLDIDDVRHFLSHTAGALGRIRPGLGGAAMAG